MGVAELLDRQGYGAEVEDGRHDGPEARELRSNHGRARDSDHAEVGEVPVPGLDGDKRLRGGEDLVHLPDHLIIEGAGLVEVATDGRVAASDLDPHRPLEAI
jgi:hypothetical protein